MYFNVSRTNPNTVTPISKLLSTMITLSSL